MYGLILTGNIKKLKEIKGERRENKWEVSVRVTEHERLLTLGKNKGWWKRRWAGGW